MKEIFWKEEEEVVVIGYINNILSGIHNANINVLEIQNVWLQSFEFAYISS